MILNSKNKKGIIYAVCTLFVIIFAGINSASVYGVKL